MLRTLTFIYSKSPEEAGVHCKCSNFPEEAKVLIMHPNPDPNDVVMYGCFEHWLWNKCVWLNYTLILKLKSNLKLYIRSRGRVELHTICSSWYTWYGTGSSTFSKVCQIYDSSINIILGTVVGVQ